MEGPPRHARASTSWLRRAAGAFALDVAAVVAFVVAGTRTHETSTTPSGLVSTAAPFVLGVLAGWAVSGAWRRPLAMRTGAFVFGNALGMGMLIRRTIFREGTAPHSSWPPRRFSPSPSSGGGLPPVSPDASGTHRRCGDRDQPKCVLNQSPASCATRSSVPGSSKRCVAPSTRASSTGHLMCSIAVRLSSRTW